MTAAPAGSSAGRGQPAGTGARSASAACSSAVEGQIGLKLYHCSGAAAMVSAKRVGDRLRRALELGRVGRADRDRLAVGDLEGPAVRGAPDRDVHDRRAGLGGECRGPGRERRPRVEHADRDVLRRGTPSR